MSKRLVYLISFVFVLAMMPGVANAGLIAHWPFDEGEGDVAQDVVGGFDAQLTNVDWVADQFGGSALETDRGGDEILAGTGPTPTTQDLTLAFWMVDNWDSYCTLMNKSENDSTAGYAIMPRQNEADCLLFRIGGFQNYGGWGSECSLPDGAYTDGEWVHIVCTYDSATDTATIYVDGVLVPNDNNKNPKTGIVAGPTGYCDGVNDPTQPLYIVGQREGFGGILDEVAIWDNALTAEEVLEVYNSGVPPLDPNLPYVDAGINMITWSGQAVQLDPNVVEAPGSDWTALTYAWSAAPNEGVEFSDPNIKAPSVTISKTTDNPSAVTMTLAVNNVGRTDSPVTDTMTINVYDDACLAAKAAGLATIDRTDLDDNCITNFKDFAVMAATWLDDYTLTKAVPK